MYLCARYSISEDAVPDEGIMKVFCNSDPFFFFFDLAELPTGGTIILSLNLWTNHHPPTTT